MTPANSAGSAAAAGVADAHAGSSQAASPPSSDTQQTASVLAPAGTYRRVRCLAGPARLPGREAAPGRTGPGAAGS